MKLVKKASIAVHVILINGVYFKSIIKTQNLLVRTRFGSGARKFRSIFVWFSFFFFKGADSESVFFAGF